MTMDHDTFNPDEFTYFRRSLSQNNLQLLQTRLSDCIVECPPSHRLISNGSNVYVFCKCKSTIKNKYHFKLCRFDYNKQEWKIINDGDSQWIKRHYEVLPYYSKDMESTITYSSGGTQLYCLIQTDEDQCPTLLRFCLNPNGIDTVQYLNGMIEGFPMKKIISTNKNEVHGFSFDTKNGIIHHAICRNLQKFRIVKESVSTRFSDMNGFNDCQFEFKTVMDNNGSILMVRMQWDVIELYRFCAKDNAFNISIIPKTKITWGYLNAIKQPVSFSAGCMLKGGVILFIDNISGYIFFIDSQTKTCRNSGWKVPSVDDGGSRYVINLISNHEKENQTIHGFIRPILDSICGTASPVFTVQIISNYYTNEYIHVIIESCGAMRDGHYYFRSWFYSVDTLY